MNSLIVLFVLVSVVYVHGQGGFGYGGLGGLGGGLGGGGGGGGGGGHHHLEEYHDSRAPAHYKYDYEVHDPHTHDFKGQWEHRDGHQTRGMYSLLQPDGRKRIVEYEAGKHGINYHVRYEGHAHHEAGRRHHEGGHHHGGF